MRKNEKSPIPTLVVEGQKAELISKKKAHELLTTIGSKFFTALFIDKEGEFRKINCQYLKNQSESTLGYIKVREACRLKTNKNSGENESTIRSINLQTLKELKISGAAYKLK